MHALLPWLGCLQVTGLKKAAASKTQQVWPLFNAVVVLQHWTILLSNNPSKFVSVSDTLEIGLCEICDVNFAKVVQYITHSAHNIHF